MPGPWINHRQIEVFMKSREDGRSAREIESGRRRDPRTKQRCHCSLSNWQSLETAKHQQRRIQRHTIEHIYAIFEPVIQLGPVFRIVHHDRIKI